MIDKNIVYKTLGWQCILSLGISFILGYILSFRTALSFFLGGMVIFLPGILFAKLFLRHSGAQSAKKVVNAFFYGESIKWLAMVVIFILVLQWSGLQSIPFFLGIILAQLIYWVAFLFSKP